MPTVTVVIPCFTERRWDSLLRAYRSVLAQTYPCRLIVVVDHNDGLLARLEGEVVDTARVIANRFPQGASGARNTGVEAATSDLVAFLEDDATAEPTWIERLVFEYERSPTVVGLGGAIHPSWDVGMPRWFPQDLLWAVGGTDPRRDLSDVRNVWGGNMMTRREAFIEAGGFNTSFGKLGTASQPEDTELCIRMNRLAGALATWRYVPDAVVHHTVSLERSRLTFLLRRCWSEGRGKRAMIALRGGSTAQLTDERAFAKAVLTSGIWREITSFARGDRDGILRAGALMLGTVTVAAAFFLPGVNRGGRRQRSGVDNRSESVSAQP